MRRRPRAGPDAITDMHQVEIGIAVRERRRYGCVLGIGWSDQIAAVIHDLHFQGLALPLNNAETGRRWPLARLTWRSPPPMARAMQTNLEKLKNRG